MFCVLNVGPAGCGGLGRARLGTDAEDYFFLEPVTLTPTWMRPTYNNQNVCMNMHTHTYIYKPIYSKFNLINDSKEEVQEYIETLN